MRGQRSPRLLALAMIAWTFGCSEPTLVAEDLERSAERVRRTLDEAQQGEFDDAIELVRMVQEGSVPGTTSVAIDGMTAHDLLAEARRIGLRRDITALEETIAAHEQVLSEGERLARLSIDRLGLATPDDAMPSVTARVSNATEQALSSAFVRLLVTQGERKLLHKTEEYLPFEPLLNPGEMRDVEVRVSRDFARLVLATPEARLAATFTSFEGGGEVLAQEPARDQIDRASRAAVEARERLAELKQRLAEV